MMKSLYAITSALFLTIATLSSAALAHDVQSGDLTIMHPWARATAKSAKTGAAYFMISNQGKTADKLVDVKSDVAKKTEIHLSSMKDGMMKMERVDGVKVPANDNAELKPGSYHIMFMGLKAPFKTGTKFPLTLVFEKGGVVEINVMVQKGPAMKKMDHDMKKMDHNKKSTN
jgi:periplasmic copper chaperone A